MSEFIEGFPNAPASNDASANLRAPEHEQLQVLAFMYHGIQELPEPHRARFMEAWKQSKAEIMAETVGGVH